MTDGCIYVAADKPDIPELTVFHLRQKQDGALVSAIIFEAIGELREHGDYPVRATR